MTEVEILFKILEHFIDFDKLLSFIYVSMFMMTVFLILSTNCIENHILATSFSLVVIVYLIDEYLYDGFGVFLHKIYIAIFVAGVIPVYLYNVILFAKERVVLITIMTIWTLIYFIIHNIFKK